MIEHTVVDLYRTGLHKLTGRNGGHAKHLARNILCLRTRANIREGFIPTQADTSVGVNDELELNEERPQMTLLQRLDEAARTWDAEADEATGDIY